MLRLPPFRFQTAGNAEEAARILADDDRARVVAGGTDLYPNMKRRHQTAQTVVSLGGAKDLRGFSGEPSDEIRIGALTTLTEVTEHPWIRERHPALARAVASISSPVLRNMGTIGGNLCLDTRCTYYNQNEEWRRSIDYCMKEAGEVCWVAPGSPRCWAISASDSAPMLCALGARVRLVSKEGERVIDLHDLYHDDGIAYLKKERDEILTDVLVPALDEGARATFWKLRRRGSIDFAVLTVAPVVWLDQNGVVERAKIFMGAVKSFPSPATAVAESLIGKKLDEESITAAAKLARKAAIPMDNTDFVARWRGQMTVRYMEAALRELAGLDPKLLAPKHQIS